jgi:hypothetical protein
VEAALGEAFGTQPKALAIIGQEFQRRAGAVAENIDSAPQGILLKCLATEPGEAIYPLPKVDRLHG